MTITIPNDSLEIRPIAQNELDTVLEVYRQCEDFLALGPVPTASMEMVLKDIEISKEEGGIFCGIYRAGGTMIGVLDYVPSNYNGDLHAAYLSLLMMAAPFRRKGMGKAVVDAIENEITKDPQVSTILAGVQVNNPQAIQFWQRNGYRIVSGSELMPDQTTVYGLRKDLNRQSSKASSGPVESNTPLTPC
jgi:ribosomal protein S18 acetylase RimI-like enzyme